MRAETITLYFSQGSADKVYQVNLLPVDTSKFMEGWVVTFAYGRRGKPMTTGKKTKTLLPYDQAKVIYDKLVHAKQLKGYTTGANVPVYSDNPRTGEATGYMPQLLNEVDQMKAEDFYLANKGNIAMQVKWDGERRGIAVNKGEVIASNRTGRLTTIQDDITAAFQGIYDPTDGLHELDTEDMGKYLVVFDVLTLANQDIRNKSFRQRATLLTLLEWVARDNDVYHLVRVDTPFYPESLIEFREFIEICYSNNEEGVVIRLADSLYEPGRPNSGGSCLKLKFIGEATCQVIGHVTDKASVEIGVRSDTYPHTPYKILPIGKVTIPPNYDIPKIGALVEIKYMNIMRDVGARLFQPRFKGLRKDKTEADLHSTLKFKKEN